MNDFETFEAINDRMLDGGGLEQGESILEERFWDLMNRTKERHRLAKAQFEIGPYRVDSIFRCGNEAVVIELDGKAFHSDQDHDRRRDKFLCRYVSAVIRIPFRAIWNCPDATFAILGTWYARFCIEHSAIRLETSSRALKELGSRQMYSISPDHGFVGRVDSWHSSIGAYRIGIQRGTTDPEIFERI